MKTIDAEKIDVILATDCGSTTSKARFFKRINGEYRFICTGEAPTTVEAPYEDVTYGVKNAIREVEELTGHRILKNDGSGILESMGQNAGVDLYVTTSSAGGGLQMMCTGVIRGMTAESAERAALGAGAIVMDVLANDDGRALHEKISRIRSLRPDIVLIAGGTDGGDTRRVLSIAETVRSAEPKARFGAEYSLPIIYAGNKDARTNVEAIFGKTYALKIVDNVRPTLEIENPDPARNSIHECFMEHVMSHAPGYDKLMMWTPVPIMPTPGGEGLVFQLLAKMRDANVIGVGLGGATTNIYSVFDGRFVRTVSANLGMSYSMGNVLNQTGMKNVLRWIPFRVDESRLRDTLYNKMIRPTIIPNTVEDLMLEHAVAREALRLGFNHHKFLARPLRGALRDFSKVDNIFLQEIKDTLIDMLRLNYLGGTGGLLSHAPRRVQSALVLIDGFQAEGVTRLFQDSVFMFPHLGVLSTVSPKAAYEIFEKDAIIRLGTCIAPSGLPRDPNEETTVAKITLRMSNGEVMKEEALFGTIKKIPLPIGQTATAEIEPDSHYNVGAGLGKRLEATLEGGVVGVIIDARGRPIVIPEDEHSRLRKLNEWFAELDAYPTLAS